MPLLALALTTTLSQVATPEVIFGTPRYATDLAVADVDQDGDLDVLVTSRDDGLLRLIRAGGSRSFEEAEIIGGGLSGARAVATLDVDGDGWIDAVTGGEYSDRLELHRNLGGGAFAAPELIESQVDRIWRIVPADMDGDGDQDLVVAAAGENGILWLELTGSGQFAPSQVLVSGVIDVRDVEVVDLNGDGLLDLFTASPSTGRFTWTLNLGAAAFGPPEVLAIESGALAVGAADMDGDGDVDLLTGARNAATVRVYASDGASMPAFTSVFLRSAGEVSDVGASDIDADGDMDFVWASRDRLLATRQTASGGFGNSIVSGLTRDGNLSRVRSVDLDQDGRTDLLSASIRGTGSANGDAIRALWNDPGGLLTNAQRLQTRWDMFRSMRALDLGVDGRLETVALASSDVSSFSPSRIVTFDSSNGGPLGRQDGEELDDADFLYVAEISGDGRKDVVIRGRASSATGRQFRWKSQEPDGTLGLSQLLFFQNAEQGNAWVDVDGDGDDDFVSFDYDGSTTYLRENLGGQMGTRQDWLVAPSGDFELAAELTGDAFADVVREEGGQLWLYPADASGGFAPAVSLGSVQPTRDRLALDADGDGDTDLVIQQESAGVHVWSTYFLEGGALDTVFTGPPQVERLRNAQAVDWDGDGQLDLLGRAGSEGIFQVVMNDGTGRFTSEQLVLDASSTSIASPLIEVADLDGDTDADILAWSGSLVFWVENERELGTQSCPGEPNSTGESAELLVAGSDAVPGSGTGLSATQLPMGTTTLFLASPSSGFAANPAGSQGNICLGGPIGRYVGPGDVQTSDAAGIARLPIDVAAIPTPNGPVTAVAGETWYFQAWYRDANPGNTSNFSSAVGVTFR